MNTFDNYWDNLVRKNPQLAYGDVKITMSTMEFKKRLRHAFEANKYVASKGDFGDIFSDLFRSIKKDKY